MDTVVSRLVDSRLVKYVFVPSNRHSNDVVRLSFWFDAVRTIEYLLFETWQVNSLVRWSVIEPSK